MGAKRPAPQLIHGRDGFLFLASWQGARPRGRETRSFCCLLYLSSASCISGRLGHGTPTGQPNEASMRFPSHTAERLLTSPGKVLGHGPGFGFWVCLTFEARRACNENPSVGGRGR